MKYGITVLLIFLSSFSLSAQEDCGNRPNIGDETIFTPAQRAQLAQLIIDYVTSEVNPKYDPDGAHPNNLIQMKYDIVAQHTDYGQGGMEWHNFNEYFLEWHREYIAGLEQYLLDKGYPEFVPLPAWDITEPLPSEFWNKMVLEFEDAFLFDAVGPPPHDGTAQFKSDPLQTWGDYVVTSEVCDDFEDADDFGSFIQGWHGPVHGEMGGAMRSTTATSGTAVFWLYHAFVDEKYHCYQLLCQCPQVDLSTYVDRCDYCLKLDGSVNADEFEFTLIDVLGNEQIVELNDEGCIPYHLMNQGEPYTLIIKGINTEMTDNIDCPEDEIIHDFTAPNIQPTKWNPIPCIRIYKLPLFPQDLVMLTNNGGGTTLNITNTNINTGATTLIGQNLTIDEDETIDVTVLFSVLPTGTYYFSVEFEGEETGFEYFIP